MGREHQGLWIRPKLKTSLPELKEKSGHGQDTPCKEQIIDGLLE